MERCRTPSVTEACRFRPEFAQLDLADQLAMLGNCVEVAASALWECDAKQQRLSGWIEEGK